jgi:Spy/CpxP family protein refolding chaperone
MRKSAVVVLAMLALVSCAEDATAPDEGSLLEHDAILAFDAGGVSDPGRHMVAIHRLPRELRLSADQEARLKVLLERFQTATQPDREELARIQRQAGEARKAGKPREEIARILAQADEIRKRMAAAEQALAAAILDILTAEQRAWLAAHQPRACNRNTAPPLTDAQRSQIALLMADYEEKYKADLEIVRASLERARLAQKNGASREEIARILETAKAASGRLQAAQAELARAIDALLTPEQRASGCYRNPTASVTKTR